MEHTFFESFLNNCRVLEISSLDEVAKFFYNALHMEGLIKPELSITNKNPKRFDLERILPKDKYLIDEQKRLESDSLPDFCRDLKNIVSSKKAGSIDVLFDLPEGGRIRYMYIISDSDKHDIILGIPYLGASAKQVETHFRQICCVQKPYNGTASRKEIDRSTRKMGTEIEKIWVEETPQKMVHRN